MIDTFDAVRVCRGKKRYATEDAARATALRCWEARRVWLRAYPCVEQDGCGGWHLTRLDAPPVMQAGWRYPKKSRRQQALERKQRRRRGKR